MKKLPDFFLPIGIISVCLLAYNIYLVEFCDPKIFNTMSKTLATIIAILALLKSGSKETTSLKKKKRKK